MLINTFFDNVFNLTKVDNQVESSKAIFTPASPPPPPPLPNFLRSKPPALFLKSSSTSSLNEVKKTLNNGLSLMDVLKDIGNVKLRKVEVER